MSFKYYIASLIILNILTFRPLFAQHKISEKEYEIIKIQYSLDNKGQRKNATLFLKDHKSTILLGDIAEIKKDGIIFNPQVKEQSAHSGPNFYNFNKIKVLIDKDGRIIFGSIKTLSNILGIKNKNKSILLFKKAKVKLNTGRYAFPRNTVLYRSHISLHVDKHNTKIFDCDDIKEIKI